MNSGVDRLVGRPFVLDASVLVARVRVGEPGHPSSQTLLSRLLSASAQLCVPAIATAEVAAALKRGTGDETWSLRAVADLKRLPGLRIIPVDERLGDLAADIASRHSIRGCDAIYVALARALAAVLVTLDREQLERSPADVVARTPAQAAADLDTP
ncbi:MAG: PIN domain-containing protein [Ardenticatenales bacterium]